ncbi:hypothetical protein GF351_06210, partial [Candidatus Woesearchaeota archaeon]|nr:hypothetical protein [Candidatus Woesearchaeota archaeon]
MISLVIFSGCTRVEYADCEPNETTSLEKIEKVEEVEEVQEKDTASETDDKTDAKEDDDKDAKDEDDKTDETKAVDKSDDKDDGKKEVAEEEKLPTVKVTETELVSLPNLKARDPDGDKVTFKFSRPLDSKGEWQTKVGDAGNYTATIIATDGKDQTSTKIRIIVWSKNKPPKLAVNNAKVSEGKTLTLKPVVSDPNGDKIRVTYSRWMTSASKKVGYDEAGVHQVKVTASDGQRSVSKTINVTVSDVNRAPRLSPIKNVTLT